MLPIQAVNGATSKHAFSFDWGRTTNSDHYANRRGKEYGYKVIVEPGTRNIYIVGKRGTQPSQETTPGGASADHWAERAFVLKLDQQGNVLWNRELSKDGMKNDPVSSQTWRRYSKFNSICLNPLTGDLYCVGYTDAQYQDNYNWSRLSGDCLVAKYNSSGTLQYQKFYGRNKTDAGIGVEWFPLEEQYSGCHALSDGTFVAAGSTANHPGSNSYVSSGNRNYNVMLTRWNSNGTVSWSKWISIDNTQNNVLSDVSSTGGGIAGVDSSDNIYFIATGGTNGSTRGSYIMKFNSSGTLQWQKSISGIFFNSNLNWYNLWDSMVVSKSGDMYLKSYRGSGNDHGIVKLNSSGTVQWTKSFPGNGGDTSGLFIDDEGNLWLGSYFGKFICVDSNGNIIRRMEITTNGAGGFFGSSTVDEGYVTVIASGRYLGPQTIYARENNLAVFRFEISGVNNGSFTHTNSDGSTLTVTVSTPSSSSPSSYTNPSVSNSSQVSIINYAGNTPTRLNNGTCTNFTNSSPPYGSTLTV